MMTLIILLVGNVAHIFVRNDTNFKGHVYIRIYIYSYIVRNRFTTKTNRVVSNCTLNPTKYKGTYSQDIRNYYLDK